MKKCRKASALFLVLAVLLAGCGQQRMPENAEETTIMLNKGGTVAYRLVGDFEKEYYDLSELASMAAEEAAEYNGSKASEEQHPVIVEKVELLPENQSKVTIEYLFDSADSFSEFAGSVLFYGTVEEAISRGYSFTTYLTSVKDGTVLTGEQLQQSGEKKVVITDAKAVIYCPSKVAYTSNGVTVREDGGADTLPADGMVYLVMK